MREKIITTLRSITLSHVIAVKGLTIAALILLLSVGLAMTPPPIPGSGAVTALDFWAQRFQALLAAIIALGAALTAYAVAKLNHRHEKEQQKAKQKEEVTKCFRRCVLAIQRVHIQTMTLGTQARNPDRTLLTPEEAASVATELQMPEWIQTEISLLPSLFARGILKYYQAAQRAGRILYRFDESNVPGSTTHILFREWFVTAIITKRYYIPV